MTEKELRNLQVYIGKRNQSQTDEQVIAHINQINDKTPLSQEEWHKLIYPCCNNGHVKVLRFILEHITPLNDVLEYMKHTVYGRNERITSERIEALKLFLPYLSDNRVEYLSETMLNAAWFGETEIVQFLLEIGADRAYQNANGLSLEKCAERAEKVFQDRSLKEFLCV